jgi:hypothetical protein
MGTTSKVVEEAIRRFKLVCEAEGDQRKREKEDLQFQVPELQWEDGAKAARESCVIDGVTIPARPMISIPKLDQPVQLVLNQEKAAHLGVKIHPLDEDADDDTAEVIQGLYRDIERNSRAGLARSWAFDRAVKSGRGAYRVNTRYCDYGGNPFDQDIRIERILHQEAAYFDPSAQEPDWSDGEWAFVTSWVPLDTFKRLYPGQPIEGYSDTDFLDQITDTPEWVRYDEDEKALLVVEYFRKEYTDREWVILADGSFSYADEVNGRPLLEGDGARTRKVKVPTVKWSKIYALDELESEDWNGRYIPIIPVIGRELIPFDSKRRWTGIIGPAKGAARMFNYAASSAIELAALEPKAPYIMYEGQDEGFESMWQQANIRNFPALKINKDVVLPGGVPAPPPMRSQADVGKLGPSMMLLEKADQFLQAATSNVDPSALEQLAKRRVAHQTIGNLASQGDYGNSHFLNNLADVSMTYEAKVVLDLLPKIYDRPGRVARILDGEDNADTVMLNAPFVQDQKTGRPRQLPDGQQDPKAKQFDLRKGTYGVSVSVGKSFNDRLQEGAETLGGILERNPELMPLIGATYFKFRTEPGMKELADILKKVRAQQYPGLEDEDENDPEVLAQKAKALEAKLQEAQQQLEQAAEMIRTEAVKQMGQKEIAQENNAAKVQLEGMKIGAEIRLAEIEAQARVRLEAIKAQADEMERRSTFAHEARQSAATRSADWDMAEEAATRAAEQLERQAELGFVQSAQDHGESLDAGAQGHQQAMEQTEQAAELAPKPEASA